MDESSELDQPWPRNSVLVRCGGTDFRGEYREVGPGTALVSLVFDDWYPAMGDAVWLLDGTSRRRATVYSVRVSPREQRVELHVDLTR